MILNLGVVPPPFGPDSILYTGNYTFVDDGENNWRIKFLSSGTLTFKQTPKSNIDVFLVGGGAAGSMIAGGAGGRTLTEKDIAIAKNTPYAIVVGAGGINGGIAVRKGGSSTAFGYEAEGAISPSSASNGATNIMGGSGAGGGSQINDGVTKGGAGGSDGGNGKAGSGVYKGTKGQGTTTREFGEATGALYAGGGGGYGANHKQNTYFGGAGGAGGGGRGGNAGGQKTDTTYGGRSGTANTGGGGGGGISKDGSTANGYAGNGGSGIVIIRNTKG